MKYNVYCIVKEQNSQKEEKVVRVKVIADCISEAISVATSKLLEKLKKSSFQIFMYETVK